MQHYIRTTYGDSDSSMQTRSTDVPFQGILQGNGAAPATWVVISTPLLNMMRTAGNGGRFKDPISNTSSHIVGFAFVDDADLLEFTGSGPTATTHGVMQNNWRGNSP